MQFAGPAFVSLGHHIMTAPHLPDERKKELVVQMILPLLEDFGFDGVLIGMPQRASSSGTNAVFMDPWLNGVTFCALNDSLHGQYYFFSWKTEPHILLNDPEFIHIITTISHAWNDNFQMIRDKADPHESEQQHEILKKIVASIL